MITVEEVTTLVLLHHPETTGLIIFDRSKPNGTISSGLYGWAMHQDIRCYFEKHADTRYLFGILPGAIWFDTNEDGLLREVNMYEIIQGSK